MRVNAFVFIVLFLIFGLRLDAEQIKPPKYLKYVKEIVNDFVDYMEKKYDLHCYGSGGSMPYDVQEIEVLFTSYHKSTVEDARKMEVDGIENLLRCINNHQKIKPYLREYPFKVDRVGVSISFETEGGGRPLDGSVAYVFLANNKIFYRAAEIRIQKPIPFTYMNDKNEVVREFIEGGPEEELISLMEESYEEALKIIANGP